MAKLLAMDERSYVYLDHGKTGCSSLTLVRFLIYCCDDPALFLSDLKVAFEQETNYVAKKNKAVTSSSNRAHFISYSDACHSCSLLCIYFPNTYLSIMPALSANDGERIPDIL